VEWDLLVALDVGIRDAVCQRVIMIRLPVASIAAATHRCSARGVRMSARSRVTQNPTTESSLLWCARA